ncbi:MAG: hypothetical protein ACLPY1_13355 [Terracidiphilus sp.]
MRESAEGVRPRGYRIETFGTNHWVNSWGEFMDRVKFTAFVNRTLEEVIELAEEKAGRKLSRRMAFQWLAKNKPRLTDGIAEHIVERVFIDEEHIYPCVDIGVGDLLEDGTILIVGSVAGYAPRPFGKNWTEREGPFVHILGAPFLSRLSGEHVDWSPESAIFGFSIPDMKKLG